jgi:uncharacterized protein
MRFGYRVGVLALLSLALLNAEIKKIPLIEAAKKGDVAAVRALLAQHTDVNVAMPDGATALMWAARSNSLEVTELLLRAGANANAVNQYGVGAINLAATNGNAGILEKLLIAKANPNAALPAGETVLMTASRTGNLDAVKVLLKYGADPNKREEWRGQTALMWAAAEGHADVVKALLASGADLRARAKAPPPRISPYALSRAQTDAKPASETKPESEVKVVSETKTPPDPSGPNKPAILAPGATPADGKPLTKRSGNPSDFSPFLFAVRGGQMEVVKALLEAGADPNEALSDGQTALHLAAMNAHYELGVLLMEKGADPKASACGWTPLHQVAWTRRPNIHKTPAAIPTGKVDSLAFTKALIAHGADVNALETKEPKDGNLGKLRRSGATAFLLAAKSADFEYMRFLASLGADPRIMTNEQVTPLEAAAGVGIYRVAESPGSNEDAFEAVKVAYELGHGDKEYVNHVDKNGRTAMHGAALRGSNAIVQYLYDRGANLDVVDKLGWSPLVITDGVFYPNVFKTELQTSELLRKLGAKEREVSEEVRYAGIDKDGRENGADATVGGGGFFEEPPPVTKAPVAPATPTTPNPEKR